MNLRPVVAAVSLSLAWLWVFTPQSSSHAGLIEQLASTQPPANEVTARQATARQVTARQVTARQVTARQVTARQVTDAFTPSPIIAALITQVQSTRLYSDLAQLSGETSVSVGGQPYTITTRNTRSGEPIQKATQYMYERFQGLGISAQYHNWTACSANSRNVIGTITGTLTPNEIVLITAHLDDMPSSGRAPGADDNGSGSIGVLMAAELLRTQSFERTVRFVLFTGEEQGLCGSDAYASAVYAAGDNIVAVYNLDMIAYDSGGAPTLRLHTRTTGHAGYPADLAIASVFTNVVSAYGLSGNLTPIVTADGESASDHSEFWSRGYPAILAIEDDYNDFNAYYHTINDNLSHINLAYFTNFVKASVGTAAHLARPSVAIIAGLVSHGQTGSPITNAQVWITSTGTTTNTLVGADGRYRFIVPDGEYQLTASAPGFNSKTYDGVIAQSGLTTTRDFDLLPAAIFSVAGVVSDVMTGRPLSATILITGYPYSPIGTNSDTGQYQVALAEGGVYTFHVRAVVPGYAEAIRVVGPLMTDRVEDFPLAPDLRACSVPGYHLVGLYESFDAASLPGGWTAIDTGGQGAWRFDNPAARPNYTGGAGNFAIADSAAVGQAITTELRSPLINFTTSPSVTLTFQTHLLQATGQTSEAARVQVSVDGGATWPHTVFTRTADVLGPYTATLDLSALAAHRPAVQVRFVYQAEAADSYWQVDEVQIGQCLLPGVPQWQALYLPVVIAP